MRTMLIALLCSSLALADDVTSLTKGQVAPFSGVLLSTMNAETLRIKVLEREYFENISKSYEKSLSIVEHNYNVEQQKTELLTIQNDKLAVGLQEARSTNSLDKWLYIALGAGAILLGGILVKSVK